MDQSPRKIALGQTRGEEETNARNKLAMRLVTILDPTSATSEAYRSLRTNLIYTSVDEPSKVIVLTSPGPGEGKSTVCANLGVVLAQAGKSPLIIDCDFRNPAMHKFFGLRNLYGLVDVLAGEYSLQETWKEPVEGVKVITVGHLPPNPAELVGTGRFSEFLVSVRQQFDYILIDSPPVGRVSDPAILAAQGDGVLLVLDAQKTRKGSVRQAVRDLQAVGAKVLGTVINNAKYSQVDSY